MGGQQADRGGSEVFKALEADDPTTVAGYRLAARLGAGGMGKVYLSYTPGGRPVAIKLIRPEFGEDAEFRRRFAQEVRSAQRVQGLFTAPVIDADPDGAQPWLATAYVPGPSLADAVVSHGALPVETVLLLVAGMAEALHVIHGAGIVHRDLKPSNVLLASDGPRVIDFGIAHAADATSLTGSGVTIGTPSFMAPEQAAGRKVTSATDVFALGQVAAYAATGVPAFGEGTGHGVLYRIVHEQPDLSAVPERLTELVTRCLAKDPEARPSLSEIISLCQAANAATVLRRPEDWLPGAVSAEITARAAAPAPPQTPPPPTTAPTVAPAPTAAPPGYAPTAPAAPSTPPSTPPPGYGPPPHTAPTAPAAPVASSTPVPPPAAAGPAPAYPYAPTQGPGSPAYAPTQGPGTGAYAPTQGPGGPAYPQQPYPGGPAPAGYAPQQPPQQPKKRGSRGLVIAVAAVLAFSVAGGATAYVLLKDKDKGGQAVSNGGGKPNGKSSPSTQGSGGTGTGTGTGTESSAPKPSTAPAPQAATYKNIDLTAGYHLTLGDTDVRPQDGEDNNYDLSYDTGGYLDAESSGGNLVLLDPGQEGSLEACRAETRFTQNIYVNKLSPGRQVCVTTGTGHLGLVTVKAFSPEDSPSTYMTLDLTVWRNAAPSASSS
ncbi:serine/threonine-protein kinase [Streptomyces vietnamensis]|uniref:Serine/threonine protein kinase n=1 Tax=Streptomyces vietnamensis TaxID=362257 RepID=A0A0B5IKC4_9ACTN|nr:serine/threonine-protein kinase [Streptomyces vietnamensis]AJF68829.1 serine/threonine protein kinase [Streptomyces vietnamensis]